jgi:hypothetical protein
MSSASIGTCTAGGPLASRDRRGERGAVSKGCLVGGGLLLVVLAIGATLVGSYNGLVAKKEKVAACPSRECSTSLG